MSDSLRPYGWKPSRLLYPRNFPCKNTGTGCDFPLQGIFLTKWSNPHLLHWQVDSLTLHHLGSPHTFIARLKTSNLNVELFFSWFLFTWKITKLLEILKWEKLNSGISFGFLVIPMTHLAKLSCISQMKNWDFQRKIYFFPKIICLVFNGQRIHTRSFDTFITVPHMEIEHSRNYVYDLLFSWCDH